ncbi:MAG: hypothetical protein LBE86_16125, partial [Gemmobacter sp.]|nr:hypothetical protein [Gemmobacter sp.]
GEIKAGPVVKPLAPGARACRKTLPGLGQQVFGDAPGRPADGMGLPPGIEGMPGADARDMALPAENRYEKMRSHKVVRLLPPQSLDTM